MTIAHLTVDELADRPVADAICARGKELQVDDAVAAARALFTSGSVRLVPVLDGDAYVGAVLRDDLPDDAPDAAPVVGYADRGAPTATASTPLGDALGALDAHGGRRLVVLADDASSYLGLLCLRSDRRYLCVDAECHATTTASQGAPVPAISADDRVADLVLADPGRARVFEKLGIDYCCGGEVPLADACAALALDADDVVALLLAPRDREAEDVDWTTQPVAALVDHVVGTHHAYLREELEPLGALVAKVARAHGDRHPELREIEVAFTAVAAELAQHLPKEELVVFPAAVRIAAGEDVADLDEAIAEMRHDHDAVGAGLARLRELTGGYAPPADACNSYRAMLDRLATLEADTHRHVHEENNVLFVRVLAGRTA